MDTVEKTAHQRWVEQNPEKAKASQKAWRERNKEKLAADAKARRANWTEEQKEAQRERDRARYRAQDRRAEKQARRERAREADPDAFDRKQYDMNTVRRFKRTIEDYEAKLAEQGGHCAICPRTPEEEGKRLAWDHDHSCCATQWTCGECVRDLLCQRCNLKVAALEFGEYEAHENYLTRWKAST